VYSLGVLHYYQNDNRRAARAEYSSSLHKIANARLVEEVQQVFYQKIVTRVRTWYTDESQGLEREIPAKRINAFFAGLSAELGIDEAGRRPFTQNAIDWKEYRAAVT
jgi:hypothetical protein